MILTFTPNPCVDKTLALDELRLGEKHRDLRMSCVAGGKGNNAARCVHALRQPAAALVVVAGHTGQHVLDMLQHDDGLAVIPFWTQGLTRTITTIYERLAHRQTALFEPGPNLSADEVRQLLALYEGSLEGATFVTLNGAVPCASMDTIYADMIRLAQARGIPTLLDAYGPEFAHGLAAIPDIVKLNKDELCAHVDYSIYDDASFLHAMQALAHKGIEIVIVSDGANPLHALWKGVHYRVTPPPVEEVNAVGSGDVFAGALAVAVLRGDSPEQALTFAAAAGAANAAVWDIGHFNPGDLPALQAKAVCEIL